MKRMPEWEKLFTEWVKLCTVNFSTKGKKLKEYKISKRFNTSSCTHNNPVHLSLITNKNHAKKIIKWTQYKS